MKILRAGPDDWPRIRDLRLRALQDAPDAFGSTFENESGNDEADWRSWASGWASAADQALFAAIEDGTWRGIALGVRWGAEEELVHLYAMWVDPGYRRRGAGRALVDAVVGWAGELEGVRRVRLAATVTNPAAIELYAALGFVDTGERTPLREGSGLLTMRMERKL